MVKTRLACRLLLVALVAGLLSCAGEETAERPPRTFLRLPVAGTWRVAADEGNVLHLVPVAAPPVAPGRPAVGDWDTAVLVPAAGTVVAVVDDLPEGPVDPAHPRGNHVVIRHRADEFTVLGGLRAGSLRVQVGDDVFPGHEIARLADSGGDPSGLRFELLDAAHGRPLPIAFHMYESDGRRRSMDFPRTGDEVRSLWVGVAVPDTTR